MQEDRIEIEDGELGGDVVEITENDVSSLTQDELEIRRQKLLEELESEMKAGDCDYRIAPTKDVNSGSDHVIDLTGASSDSDKAEVQILEVSDIEVDSDTKIIEEVTVVDSCSSGKEEEKLHMQEDKELIKMATGDTDYRMCSSRLNRYESQNPDSGTSKQDFLNDSDDRQIVPKDPGKNVTDENIDVVESENISSDLPETAKQDLSPDASLPDRTKFAKGITQFDAYYTPSESRGVYKKLSSLLRDSPRRQEK